MSMESAVVVVRREIVMNVLVMGLSTGVRTTRAGFVKNVPCLTLTRDLSFIQLDDNL